MKISNLQEIRRDRELTKEQADIVVKSIEDGGKKAIVKDVGKDRFRVSSADGYIKGLNRAKSLGTDGKDVLLKIGDSAALAFKDNKAKGKIIALLSTEKAVNAIIELPAPQNP